MQGRHKRDDPAHETLQTEKIFMSNQDGVIETGAARDTGMQRNPVAAQRASAAHTRLNWVWNLLLIGVLLIGGYFRFLGLNWDDNQHLHPDERFLTMVETSIQPVRSLGEYFDTANSSLNPHNRGYGFYVYGTLPLFVVCYMGEWMG